MFSHEISSASVTLPVVIWLHYFSPDPGLNRLPLPDGTTEVRDVALAMLVRLNGQQTKDYGFAFLQFHGGQQIFFAPVWLGFADDAKRTAAIKKYRDWKAAQKK